MAEDHEVPKVAQLSRAWTRDRLDNAEREARDPGLDDRGRCIKDFTIPPILEKRV